MPYSSTVRMLRPGLVVVTLAAVPAVMFFGESRSDEPYARTLETWNTEIQELAPFQEADLAGHAEKPTTRSVDAVEREVERHQLPDLNSKMAEATTVAEVVALLRTSSPPADSARRLRACREARVVELAEAEERLRQHRVSADLLDPENRLEEKRLLVRCLTIERDLAALRDGDYYFGPYRRYDLDGFEIYILWSDPERRPENYLVGVFRREADPLLRQLRREIDHEEKVAAFNANSGGTRRRILALRAKSLAEDPIEEQRWMDQYFPEEFRIDELTGTIY